jgi:DNA-binding NarL/FixJ family response regulator
LVDTPVRLLIVDLDARYLGAMADLADEATGAIQQCRLEYLDLVMISAGSDEASGLSLLETIRTLRPTVRAVLMNGLNVPIRQMLRDLRSEPRHVPAATSFSID